MTESGEGFVGVYERAIATPTGKLAVIRSADLAIVDAGFRDEAVDVAHR